MHDMLLYRARLDADKDYVRVDDEKKRKKLKGLGYKIRVIKKIDDVRGILSDSH